jgi:carbohydrate-selective porin OprB
VGPGRNAFRHLLDLGFSFDPEPLVGWSGASLFVNFQNQAGDDGSLQTGDLQVYSNIDADGRTQLAELFVEQALWSGGPRLKVGKMDANTDFATVDRATDFLNSSFGYSPTILGFPTYPDPAVGAALFAPLPLGLEVRAGVFDGALQEGVQTGNRGPSTLFGEPADLFLIGELQSRWLLCGHLRGKVTAGVWRHTGRFARFDGGSERGTDGPYLVVQQKLWREAPDPDSTQGLGAFFQWGKADPAVTTFQRHVGGGLLWEGLLPTRDLDRTGLGATWVRASRRAGSGLDRRGELAVELFHQIHVTDWLHVIVDLQYLRVPGAVRQNPDAWVGTLRVIAGL